ncbi:MAG: MOSC domain-containing protein [Actinomycetota bacterium]|nr:MOSC domain-containing protein [Actinomycetota bacterium]
MKVVSLNVALPSRQRYGREDVITGGPKEPVPSALLRFEGFDGDGQADLVNHGGVDKAVCVYPLDHYAHWERVFARALGPGAFSENLTVSGAVESRVSIGDVFRVGEALLEVSQPRTPCSKLAGKNGQRLLTKWVGQTGYTGFYMRVLSEGLVGSGDAFELVEGHPDRISVAAVGDIIFGRSADVELIERLANLPEFGGRTFFAERLARLRRGQERSPR